MNKKAQMKGKQGGSPKPKRPAMGDALRGTLNAESKAKAGRHDDLAAKVARADAVMGEGAQSNTMLRKVTQPSPSKAGDAPLVAGVLRQNVSLPPADKERLNAIVKRAQEAGAWGVNLSAITRTAIRLLDAMDDKALMEALKDTPHVPVGRKPKGNTVP